MNAGEGQTAALGEINKRITRINDELRSAHSKRESGPTREALANEADLKAEQQALSDILHKELAKRTGPTPEQVGGLRQRYGRMYSIADQTEAAMNQRQSCAGKAAEAERDTPTSAFPAETLGKVRRSQSSKRRQKNWPRNRSDLARANRETSCGTVFPS